MNCDCEVNLKFKPMYPWSKQHKEMKMNIKHGKTKCAVCSMDVFFDISPEYSVCSSCERKMCNSCFGSKSTETCQECVLEIYSK